MIYQNQVLDVEDFQHPGPQDLIESNLGKDITELFDDQGHSGYAKELCQKLSIGFIQSNQLLENQWDKLTQEEKLIHDRLDKMIDVKKPLVPQIRKMSNKEFLAFVRRPRHMDDTDGVILYADKKVDDWMKYQ